MLVHQLLDVAATNTPDAVALIERDRAVSYGTLAAMTNQCAQVLRRCGVSAGERVLLALDNSAEMVAAYLGAMRAGGVAVPLPGSTRSDRLPVAVAECAPRVAIVEPAVARSPVFRDVLATVPHVFVASAVEPEAGTSLAAAMAEPHAESLPESGVGADLAAIVFTSGSTGQPRGVMLSHDNFVANAASIVGYLSLTAADRVMCVLPFSYVYGLSLLHTHLAVGGSVVLENRAAFPNVVLSGMAAHRVTGFAGVPSTFALMLHRSDLGRTPLPYLRYVTQAGGAMPAATIAEWLARGPRADFYVMYGATEAAARLTYVPPADLQRKPGSIGRPIPGVDVRVLTDGGDVAAPGVVGELVARGANIARGYWHHPEETAERFGPDGYRTGDLGYVDAEGFLYLTGRRHDMIKVGANRVGAPEIEGVLAQHPAILEAAVVEMEDDLLGEVPVAFVALKTESAADEEALRGFCAARLASFKVPVRVFALPELPKLPTGKLDKRSLRAIAAGRPPDGQP